LPRHISFSPFDQNVVIVTGKDVYRFYRLQENNTFKCHPKELQTKNVPDISTDISCHTWLADGRFILCNEKGQIMLMESNGEFKSNMILSTPKAPIPIHAVFPYTQGSGEATGGKANLNAKSGFVVASTSGQFRVFVSSADGSRQPYKTVPGEDLTLVESEIQNSSQLARDIEYMKVTHMALSPKEDTIVFTMSSNQIFKVPINLDRPGDDHTYEYLICAFHSHPIFGMDVCLKKNIIATCSSDRTVRVWNYGTHS
jgi:WD40 repeat protein